MEIVLLAKVLLQLSPYEEENRREANKKKGGHVHRTDC